MGLLDSLRLKFRAEAEKAANEWGSLAERIAFDEPSVTEQEVIALLKSSGRTLEDLAMDVARTKHVASHKTPYADQQYPRQTEIQRSI